MRSHGRHGAVDPETLSGVGRSASCSPQSYWVEPVAADRQGHGRQRQKLGGRRRSFDVERGRRAVPRGRLLRGLRSREEKEGNTPEIGPPLPLGSYGGVRGMRTGRRRRGGVAPLRRQAELAREENALVLPPRDGTGIPWGGHEREGTSVHAKAIPEPSHNVLADGHRGVFSR